jgi:hypothetical protein
MIQVTNRDGVIFNVRIVRKGDRYGLEDCLVYDETDRFFHENDPMVEFYDARQDVKRFGERGQFVSRYSLSTFMEHTGGLDLHGGILAWKISAGNVLDVKIWLKGQLVEELADAG